MSKKAILFDLNDLKSIDTPGCDTGFGHQAVIDLNALGFTVFAGCLLKESTEPFLQRKCRNQRKLICLQLNVTSEEDIQAAFQSISKHLNHNPNESFHGLVNNAGISNSGLIEWGTMDQFQDVLSVNLMANIRLSRRFLPLLKESPSSGRIINITSYAARLPLPFTGAYSMSKWGVKKFSQVLREEMVLSDLNVKVVTIEPTVYRTEITNYQRIQEEFKKTWSQTPEHIKHAYGQRLYDGIGFFLKSSHFLDSFGLDLAKRNKMSEVMDAIKNGLMLEEPENNYICTGWYDRIFYFFLDFLSIDVIDLSFHSMSQVFRLTFCWFIPSFVTRTYD